MYMTKYLGMFCLQLQMTGLTDNQKKSQSKNKYLDVSNITCNMDKKHYTNWDRKKEFQFSS